MSKMLKAGNKNVDISIFLHFYTRLRRVILKL